MEFVIAAAVLAIGLVAAATVYGRGGLASAGGHGTTTTGPGAPVRPREPAPARTSDARPRVARPRSRPGARALDERTVTLRREREELDARRAELDALQAEHTRALERLSGLSAGQAKQALLKEIEDQARHDSHPRPARHRGGDQARRRAPRALDPLGGDAAPRRQPRRRDDGLRRAAAQRRHEGPHHRPRGAQHPRPGEPHRRRLHHRRHARTPSCSAPSTASAARSRA